MKFNLRTIVLLLAAATLLCVVWWIQIDRQSERSRLAVMSLNATLANVPSMVDGIGGLDSGDPKAIRVIQRWIEDGVPTHEFPNEWGHHLPYLAD